MNRIINLPLNILKKFPFQLFIGVLTSLIIIIVIGHVISILKSPKETTQPTSPRQVITYASSSTAYLNLPATIDNQGSILITAQTGGIVSKINVTEGQQIKKGARLMTLGTTAWGSNPASVGRQIAQRNLDFQNQTQDTQNRILDLQSRLGDLSEDLNVQSREVTRDTFGYTNDLMDDTQKLLDQVNSQIDLLSQDPTTASGTATLQQSRLTLSSTLNQLRAANNAAQLQANDDRPPAQIAQTSHELSDEQILIQRSSQDLVRALAKLNLDLASINEAMFFPASPLAGQVQQIFVKSGQTVTPGMPLAVIANNQSTIKITVNIASSLVPFIDTTQDSQIQIGNIKINAQPVFLTQVPTQGSLHSLIFIINQAITPELSQPGLVNIPLISNQPLIPLDAVYQTPTGSYLYILNSADQQAQKTSVSTGQIIGSYIQINQGLESNQTVILSRYVQDHTPIKTN